MALYSASQLIGKPIVLNRRADIYLVSDVNNFGYKAKPYYVLEKGQIFVIDSYLMPTPGYTHPVYGIKYAERKDVYFTFYMPDLNYYAIKVKNDGRFSLKQIQQTGAITVKEEKEREESRKKGFWDKLFSGADNLATKALLIGSATFIVIATINKK